MTGGKRINAKCSECSKLTIKCYQPISYYHRKVVWQVSTDGLSYHTKVKSLNPAVLKGRETFGGVYGPWTKISLTPLISRLGSNQWDANAFFAPELTRKWYTLLKRDTLLQNDSWQKITVILSLFPMMSKRDKSINIWWHLAGTHSLVCAGTQLWTLAWTPCDDDVGGP